jgi:hypothetical protein
VSKGMVEPQRVLANLQQGVQLSKLSSKLQTFKDSGGTAPARARLGYVSAFDPQTWTVTAQIGDQVTAIPNIQVLGHVVPMVGQVGMFIQTGGDKTSQYTMIGVLTQGNTGGTTWRVRKSADQTVTNTTTIGADSHLFFYAQSERSYIFEYQLFVAQNSLTANNNIVVGWVMPSDATYTIGGAGISITPTPGNDSLLTGSGQYRAGVGAVPGHKLAFGVEVAQAAGVYNPRKSSILVSGCITMGATSGLCSVGWAQNVGAASGTQVCAGSWLKVDATSELLP